LTESINPKLTSYLQQVSGTYIARLAGTGELVMSALNKIVRKRPAQPQGDTMYRAATVAAALVVLATVAFL
jgi:hypothetical protein